MGCRIGCVITWRQPFMGKALERLVFIDETSVNTKMVKTSGWAPIGERLIDLLRSGTGTHRPLSLACVMTG
jgi:hypothetical protein